MRLKVKFILIFCFVLNNFCFSQTDTILEKKYNELYNYASGKVGDTIFSKLRYYIIIKVTDLKTGITKEICTTPFYIDAINKMDGRAVIDENNRTFKFYSDSALEYIGYFSFDTNVLKKCTVNITAEFLFNEWKKDYINFINTYSGDCQIYYAYILLKKGIISKYGCIAGEFYIIEDDKIKEERKMLKR